MNLLSYAEGRSPRLILVVISVASLLANGLVVSNAEAKATAAGLTEEQRAVHVLNRLGFGPRPGDVERVLRVGVEKYVELQLNPSSIPDPLVAEKLKNFKTLKLSNGELLARYPNPGRLVRELQRRGELPPELSGLAEGMRDGRRVAPESRGAGEMADETVRGAGATGEMAMRDGGDDGERREIRRAVMEYMRENGLEHPQRIMAELQVSRVIRAVHSERQLHEVMVDFWSNHFNVFAGKGVDRWFLTSYDRDVIRPNALGNFRDLLEETAKSPAMLFYLDNFQSMSPDAGRARRGRGRLRGPSNDRRMRSRGGPFGQLRDEMMRAGQDGDGGEGQMRRQRQRPQRGINENYARELMELHTLGVEGGYTQKDVQEVARAFTGWTIRNPRGIIDGGDESTATFYFEPRMHDAGEKLVLGEKIPAGGGIEDGRRVLDILVRHPSTARFIATKLCRRFVADEPSPALVSRVASAFSQSKGDIKTTLRALFGSPEFFSAGARRAKIKTPFEYAVSAVRTLGGDVGPHPALHQWIARMGEPLYMYQAPTGYPDTAEHWVNTGALLERMNFALALASNRIPGTRVDLSRVGGASAASSGEVDRQKAVASFLEAALQGDISQKSREVLMKQLSDRSNAPVSATVEDPSPMGREGRAAAGRRRRRAGVETTSVAAASAANPEVVLIAALVIGSPEFQRQ